MSVTGIASSRVISSVVRTRMSHGWSPRPASPIGRPSGWCAYIPSACTSTPDSERSSRISAVPKRRRAPPMRSATISSSAWWPPPSPESTGPAWSRPPRGVLRPVAEPNMPSPMCAERSRMISPTWVSGSIAAIPAKPPEIPDHCSHGAERVRNTGHLRLLALTVQSYRTTSTSDIRKVQIPNPRTPRRHAARVRYAPRARTSTSFGDPDNRVIQHHAKRVQKHCGDSATTTKIRPESLPHSAYACR
jgi:hypothetical protein